MSGSTPRDTSGFGFARPLTTLVQFDSNHAREKGCHEKHAPGFGFVFSLFTERCRTFALPKLSATAHPPTRNTTRLPKYGGVAPIPLLSRNPPAILLLCFRRAFVSLLPAQDSSVHRIAQFSTRTIEERFRSVRIHPARLHQDRKLHMPTCAIEGRRRFVG